MPTKQTFKVIHASGQDDHHKAVELNTHSPVTKGWHSSRLIALLVTTECTINCHQHCFPQILLISSRSGHSVEQALPFAKAANPLSPVPHSHENRVLCW
jgi:hypothetical protein